MNSNELIKILCENEAFKIKLVYGLQNGMIEKWDEDFLESLRRLNVFSGFSFSFLEVFEEGTNIGTCYETARALSFVFDTFIMQTGHVTALLGTPGAPNGEHVWLEVGDYIYDTTLMLKIHTAYAEVLGYKVSTSKSSEELNQDKYYRLQKEMAFEDNSWYFDYKSKFEEAVKIRLMH